MVQKIIFLLFALFLQGVFGELACEELPIGMCSFSISSMGNRCLLETFESSDGTQRFQCKTSQVMATDMHEYIESDECVTACGVDRTSFGISSDSLLDSEVTLRLCSPQCYYNCPNIVDLYYNLALGEGVVLPELCKSQSTNTRRSVIQLQSSGAVSGPMSASASAPSSTISSYSSIDCAPTPM